MMKPKWLDRSLVLSSHYFTLCTTEKQFKKVLKYLKLPKDQRPIWIKNWHSDATLHEFQHKEESKLTAVLCIRNFEGKSDAQIAGLLAHEAMHLWRWIRETYGEGSPSSEFEAYSVQNIVQQLFAEFKRQTC